MLSVKHKRCSSTKQAKCTIPPSKICRSLKNVSSQSSSRLYLPHPVILFTTTLIYLHIILGWTKTAVENHLKNSIWMYLEYQFSNHLYKVKVELSSGWITLNTNVNSKLALAVLSALPKCIDISCTSVTTASSVLRFHVHANCWVSHFATHGLGELLNHNSF